MTTTTEPAPPIRAVFFDSREEAAAALTEALRSADSAREIRDELGWMADPTKDAVVDRVGSVAAEILETDVGVIFDHIWPRYAALTRAAEETAGEPDTVRLVQLVTHQVSVDYEPRVELYLRARRTATVTVRLALTVTLRGVLAEIRDGCLTAIRAGDCLIEGDLSIAGRPVTSQQLIVDLPHAFAFTDPIRLAG
jgi:hypothetical protein